MDEAIELTIDSPDGIIDCRLEPQRNDDDELSYSATILYPNTVNGYSRSEIYCHTLVQGRDGNFLFDSNDDSILTKVRALEAQLAAACRRR